MLRCESDVRRTAFCTLRFKTPLRKKPDASEAEVGSVDFRLGNDYPLRSEVPACQSA